MTDRELLELAAKAAGVELIQMPPGVYRNATGAKPENNAFGLPTWNPLTDDGDALRLAVKLDLSSLVIFLPSTGGKRREFWTPNSGYDNGNAATTEAEYAADPLAATRRAIVRAVAEIGRQMP